MKKKIHTEHIFIPLNYNKEDGKMRDIKRKNGDRVQFKSITTAEKFCKENRDASFIVEETRTVYRITIK